MSEEAGQCNVTCDQAEVWLGAGLAEPYRTPQIEFVMSDGLWFNEAVPLLQGHINGDKTQFIPASSK